MDSLGSLLVGVLSVIIAFGLIVLSPVAYFVVVCVLPVMVLMLITIGPRQTWRIVVDNISASPHSRSSLRARSPHRAAPHAKRE